MTDARLWTDHVQRQTWVTWHPLQLVRPARLPDGRWSLGTITVDEADLLACMPDAPFEQVRQFDLVHDGWRIAPFRRFRPLVYFAAFSSPDIFACLDVAVSSLVAQGWKWDVLVVTAADTVDKVRTLLAHCGLGGRLHIAAIEPARTMLDYCMARYRLDAHPIIASSQPLLYLDTDIVCDGPLEPLMMQLVASARIHACAEGLLGEGHPDSAGHWFGWRLMAQDDVPYRNNEPGFSSGALGMSRLEIARDAFSLVLRSAYGDAARSGGGFGLQGLDQPFANYVLRKLGLAEIHLLPRALRLHRLDTPLALTPDPQNARGLVHFLGAPTATKLRAMQAYRAAIERRDATPISQS